MNSYAVRQSFRRGNLGHALYSSIPDGVKRKPLATGVFDDHLQPYPNQSPSNQTYIADLSAHVRRRRDVEQAGENGDAEYYPVGQASEYGIKPRELVFKEPAAQTRIEKRDRANQGSLIFVETKVFSVFNGLLKRNPNVTFIGVSVAGQSGEEQNPSSLPLVSVATGGTATIRNMSDFHFEPGDRVYWDFPSTKGRKPLRMTHDDTRAGLERFLPDILRMDAFDVDQLCATIATEMAGPKDADDIYADYGLGKDKESDPIYQYALAVENVLKNTNDDFDTIFGGDGPRIQTPRVRGRGEKRGADANGRLLQVLLLGAAQSALRSFIESRFIGTAQNVSAPNTGLQVLLKQ